MKKIHILNITDIKSNKIYYQNNDKTLSIDLEFCADNYEATHKKLNNEKCKVPCVGERFFGKYAYYEFYTADEHTQIYMEIKTNAFMRFISKTIGWNFHSKDFQKFYAIQKQLNACGFTTLDLS